MNYKSKNIFLKQHNVVKYNSKNNISKITPCVNTKHYVFVLPMFLSRPNTMNDNFQLIHLIMEVYLFSILPLLMLGSNGKRIIYIFHLILYNIHMSIHVQFLQLNYLSFISAQILILISSLTPTASYFILKPIPKQIMLSILPNLFYFLFHLLYLQKITFKMIPNLLIPKSEIYTNNNDGTH